MALISCPECGKKNVSSTSKGCPSCGADIAGIMHDRDLQRKKELETKGIDEGLCISCGSDDITISCDYIWEFCQPDYFVKCNICGKFYYISWVYGGKRSKDDKERFYRELFEKQDPKRRVVLKRHTSNRLTFRNSGY